MRGPGILLRLSLSPDPPRENGAIDRVVTIMPELAPSYAPIGRPQKHTRPAGPEFGLSLREGQVATVQLIWSDLPHADFFRVYRNGLPAGNTALPLFPDLPQELKTQYKVKGVHP
jgi:hypothetical protein